MFLWMLPMTPRTSVTLISPSGLRVSCLHRRHDLIGVSFHGRFQFPQLLLPLLGGRGLRFPLMSLLESENPLDICEYALNCLPGGSGHGTSSIRCDDCPVLLRITASP